jgi:hypothetical protein
MSEPAAQQKMVRLHAQKQPLGGRLFARSPDPQEEIPPTLKTSEGEPHAMVVMSRHRTRVAATSGEPDMTHVLPSRTRPARTYAALALFLAVYTGVLVFVFAPKDLISVQSPTEVIASD